MQPQAPPNTQVIRPRLESEYVKIVGETVGVTQMTQTGQLYLAEQISLLLRKIIHDAEKYAAHSRRFRVTGGDIEGALIDHGMQQHIPLGYISRRVPPLLQISNPIGEDIFVRDDCEVELQDIIESPPPKLPPAPHLRVHWLAYDGQIAPVPENIIPVRDEEEEVVEEKPIDRAAPIAKRRETVGGTNSGAGATFRAAMRGIRTKEKVVLHPPPIEPLSVEQQLYFKEIVEACVGMDDRRRSDALQSLECDTGVQALLPRLSRLIYDAIRFNLVQKCLSMLIYVVRIVRAITTNKSVKMDSVLHEMIPSVLSCMVGRKLCARPESDNHWALRDFAAKTLIALLKNVKLPFSRVEGNSELRDRVYWSLRKVFDDRESTYPMIYGTLHVLHELSSDQERFEYYGRYVDLCNDTHPDATRNMPPLLKMEADRVYSFLIKWEKMMNRSYNRHIQQEQLEQGVMVA